MKGLLGSHGSKGLNFQGPKGSSNGFGGGVGRPVLACLLSCHDLKGFMSEMFPGYQNAKGFRVSRDRGLTLAGWGFQEVWRFQNPRVSGKIYKICA